MALGRQGDHSAATLQQGKRRAKSTRRFVPVAVNMRMQAPGGPAIQVTTVRLVPKVAE